MKACHDLSFCSKKLHTVKVAIQWGEKDFQLSFWFYFHSKGQAVLFAWSFLKVAIQWKWKQLPTVISGLLSYLFLKVKIESTWKGFSTWSPKQKQVAPLLVICFESRNPMKWKELSTSFWLCFPTFFWKSQFNENEKDFQLSFLNFVFTAQASRALLVIFFESRNSMKWKPLSTVILPLLSHFFWKSQFNENEKHFQLFILTCFHSSCQPGPFGHLFWKSQFNEN